MRTIAIVAAMLITLAANAQQRVSKYFSNESLAKALVELDGLSKGQHISFVYNELEDFVVTTSVEGKTLLDAVKQVVGFYPMEITVKDGNIFVECIQKAKAKMRGRVVDENGQSLSFANVSLLNPADSAVLNHGVANENGQFVVPCDAPRAIVKITFVGYKTLLRTCHTGDLGTVRMRPDKKVLKTSVVEGSRLVQKPDGYTITPDAALLKRSLSAVEVLNGLHLPGLDVDMVTKKATINDGSIVYKINGVPKNQNDVLSIDPSRIARIDYSDNPSVRYVTSGVGGVVNIILKERVSGGSVREDGSKAVTTGMFDNNLSASYNYKKSEFGVGWYASNRNYHREFHNGMERYTGGGDTIVRSSVSDAAKFHYWQHNINANYVWQRDEHTMFSARYSMNTQIAPRTYPNNYVETVNSTITDSFASHYHALNKYYGHSIDAFFRRDFNDNNSLEVNVVGAYTRFNNRRDQTYTYTDGHQQINNSGVDNNRRAVTAEAVFEHRMKWAVWRLGMNNQYSNNHNSYLDGLRSRLADNTNYSYTELSGRFNSDYGYSIGTGLKVFSVDNNSRSHTWVTNNTVLRLFGKTPVKGLTFDAIGLIMPNLPSIGSMDSIIQRVDSYEVMAGNPGLRPAHEYYGRVLLRYGYRHLSMSTQWAYEYTKSPIYSNVYSYDDGMRSFVRRSVNGKYYRRLENQNRIGLYELLGHINVSAKMMWKRYDCMVTDYGNKLSIVSFSVDASAYWGKWSLWFQYKTREKALANGQTVAVTGGRTDLQLTFRFNNNWQFYAASYWLMGRGDYYEHTTNSPTYSSHSTQVIRDNATTVEVGFVYNLNFGRRFKQAKRSLNNQDGGSSGSAISL